MKDALFSLVRSRHGMNTTCDAQPYGELRMNKALWFTKHLLHNDSGQDLIEYALIAALIALGAILAMGGLSNKIANEFNRVGNSL
jgi:pilus assembly protein Flp/PilA